MAVQLDMGHLVDVAVRSEDALLVLAAKECDLDLLAFVLACVVLDAWKRNVLGSTIRSYLP